MKNPAKALIGHMQRSEALQLLAGGVVTDVEAAALERRWQQHVEAVNGQPEFQPSDPLVEAPTEIRSLMEEFANRPDVESIMQPHRWFVAYADVSRAVLSYQRVIVVKDVGRRMDSARPDDAVSLVSLCLPSPQGTAMQGAFDPAQLAFTATSVDPNLRIARFDVANIPDGGEGQPQQLLGFRISMGSTFVQLAEYKGRWMVRDGYHRIFGLLSRGISRIPCVVVQARTFEETGAARPGFFSYEALYGSRPPLMTDYLDDRLAADVELQATMRVIRIRAEEFSVPIQEPGDG